MAVARGIEVRAGSCRFRGGARRTCGGDFWLRNAGCRRGYGRACAPPVWINLELPKRGALGWRLPCVPSSPSAAAFDKSTFLPRLPRPVPVVCCSRRMPARRLASSPKQAAWHDFGFARRAARAQGEQWYPCSVIRRHRSLRSWTSVPPAHVRCARLRSPARAAADGARGARPGGRRGQWLARRASPALPFSRTISTACWVLRLEFRTRRRDSSCVRSWRAAMGLPGYRKAGDTHRLKVEAFLARYSRKCRTRRQSEHAMGGLERFDSVGGLAAAWAACTGTRNLELAQRGNKISLDPAIWLESGKFVPKGYNSKLFFFKPTIVRKHDETGTGLRAAT